MLVEVQYDLFLTKEECMLQRLDDMQRSLSKMRRAQFAQISDVKKQTNDLVDRLNHLEENICNGKIRCFL